MLNPFSDQKQTSPFSLHLVVGISVEKLAGDLFWIEDSVRGGSSLCAGGADEHRKCGFLGDPGPSKREKGGLTKPPEPSLGPP